MFCIKKESNTQLPSTVTETNNWHHSRIWSRTVWKLVWASLQTLRLAVMFKWKRKLEKDFNEKCSTFSGRAGTAMSKVMVRASYNRISIAMAKSFGSVNTTENTRFLHLSVLDASQTSIQDEIFSIPFDLKPFNVLCNVSMLVSNVCGDVKMLNGRTLLATSRSNFSFNPTKSFRNDFGCLAKYFETMAGAI